MLLTAVVTVELSRSPLKNLTLSPVLIAFTLWPPVTYAVSALKHKFPRHGTSLTLAYVSFVRRVGTNVLVLVIADAGTAPWRTWY